MQGRRVQRIEIAAIVHATEVQDKVEKVVLNLFPPDLRSKVVFDTWKSTGHHGNPITYLKAVVEGDYAQKTFDWIMERIEPTSASLLKATIDNRIQGESILHIRFHKQYLLENKLILWDGDESVKVTVRFQGRRSLQEELRDKGLYSRRGERV